MNILADLLFPPKCAACGESLPFNGFFGQDLPKQTALCGTCFALWEKEKAERCDICGQNVIQCGCATKLMQKAGCKVFRKILYYRPGDREQVGNRVIYRIKDYAERASVAFLAAELAPLIHESMEREEWRGKSFFITYLPRRFGTVLKGGNDQAKELARGIAESLKLPLVPLIGRRQKSRTPQKFLSPAKRLSNATGAFYLLEKRKAEAEGKVAILVDDIVTSGASMTAGVRLLRRAGAKGFLAVAVASDECNRTQIGPAPEIRSDHDQFARP